MGIDYALTELRTQRLLIRPFALRDVGEQYLESLNDREHMKWSRQQGARHDYTRVREYLNGLRAAGGELFSLELLDARTLCGTLSAVPSSSLGFESQYGHVVNLGLLTFTSNTRQGFGSEAWTAVTTHFMMNPCIDILTAGTHTANVGMLRIIAKSGFRELHGSDLPLDAKESHRYFIRQKARR